MKNRPWLAPLLLGMLLSLSIFFVWNRATAIDPNTLRVSRTLRVDPYELQDTLNMLQEITKHGDISDGAWHRLQALVHSPNLEMRSHAMAVMVSLFRSRHRSDAILAVRPELLSTDGHLRSQALSVLWSLGASDWRDVATHMLNDENADARREARATLARGDRKRTYVKQ